MKQVFRAGDSFGGNEGLKDDVRLGREVNNRVGRGVRIGISVGEGG